MIPQLLVPFGVCSNRNETLVSSWVTHDGNALFFPWLLFLHYIINIKS